MFKLRFVLCLLAVGSLVCACRQPEPSIEDAVLVAQYLPKAPDGAISFAAGPYEGGTAIVGENDLAFWVNNKKAYAVSPQAQAAAPALPKAPERIRYDDAFIAAANNNEETEADRALQDAELLRQKGDYEGALQKHIWYHEHALAIDDAQGGVRLSFALSDWVELGKEYPKALEALKGIRDRDTNRLLKGEREWQLFQDVSCINDYLKEEKATVELFKRIEASDPSFASRVFYVAEPDLVAAKEFALAKKYLGDPAQRFEKAKNSYAENIKNYGNDEDSREAFRHIFTGKVVSLIRILNATGESDRAKEIQAEALKVVDTPELKEALNP